MPLYWLLFHCYWQQELVKSIWFKHTSPQTCGVYVFIRNTYVCSFVLSLAHFFHSRNSLSIFGVEAHQHTTTSSEYQEAFQQEADEAAGLEKDKCERGSVGLSPCAAGFGDRFLGSFFQGAARPISPLPERPCRAGSAAPAAPSSCQDMTGGCDSGLGRWGGQR